VGLSELHNTTYPIMAIVDSQKDTKVVFPHIVGVLKRFPKALCAAMGKVEGIVAKYCRS